MLRIMYIRGLRILHFGGNAKHEVASFCPLVELPEHHGRLKDADALAAESLADGAYGYVDTKEIYDAPTIVEAE